MPDIASELVQEFAEEARELLADWERCVLDLDRGTDPAAIEKLSRIAHNLKGTSHAIGLKPYGDFLHKVEDLIALLQSKKITLSGSNLELLLSTQNVLLTWIIALAADVTASAPPQAKTITQSIDLISTNTPPMQPKDLGTMLIEGGLVTKEDVERAAKLQNRKLGEILVDEGVVPKEAVDAVLDRQREHKGDNHSEKTIRIGAEKIDVLVELLGELSIQHSLVLHSVLSTSKVKETIDAALASAKYLREIQNHALSLRMKPLTDLFRRLERACRDVAQVTGKKINFDTQGSHLELDKTIIEAVTDPLMHIVRNAVDHGIEDPEARKKSGKKETGTIQIVARKEVDGLTLQVDDDGKGLDERKILAKAREKGLVGSDQQLGSDEILKLIFLPGFSTADTISDISGRGVGMDVVRKSTEEIGGKIDLQSRVGKGTTFTVSLPATLSIVDALIVTVDGVRYAVPFQDLSEVININDHNPSFCGTSDMIYLRNRSTLVQSLKDLLRFEPRRESKRSSEASLDASLDASPKSHLSDRIALVTEQDNERVAFEVDSIVDRQPVVVGKPIGDFTRIEHFAGSTIFGNGRPGMILNLPYLARKSLELRV